MRINRATLSFSRLQPWITCVIFLIALGLYLAAWRVFDVGSVNDDARDLLAARSIQQLSYRNFQLPNYPVLNLPLPGFPAFLSLWIHETQPHWSRYKIIPLLLVLMTLFMTRRLFARWVQPRALVLLMAAIAWNPLTVTSAVVIWADSLYLCLMVASLLLLSTILDHESHRGSALGLTFLMCAISLVRPEGCLFAFTIMAGLAAIRKYREAGEALLGVAVVGILYLFLNHHATGHLSGYSAIWCDELSALAGQSDIFLRMMGENLLTLAVKGAGASDFVPRHFISLGALVVAASFLYLIAIRGILLAQQGKGTSALPIHILAWYGGVHLTVHAAWLAIHPHYLWPIVPIFLLFIAIGLQSRRRFIQRMSVVLVGIGLVFYLWKDRQLLRETSHRLPRETFEWIDRHTEPSSFVLTPHAPALTLYTHRYAQNLLETANAEAFQFGLQQNGFTHILFEPSHLFYVESQSRKNPNAVWKDMEHWVGTRPHVFEPLYLNVTEHTTVYRVKSNDAFMKAYQLYLSGVAEIYHQDWQRGLRTLERSIQRYPLSVTMNAYGMTLFLYTDHLDAAEKYLKKAAKLNPEDPLPLLNLARLYDRMHRRDQAQHFRRAAEELRRPSTAG